MNDVCKSNKYRAQWTVSADAVRSLFPGFLDGIHYYISHWCPTADQSPPTPPPFLPDFTVMSYFSPVYQDLLEFMQPSSYWPVASPSTNITIVAFSKG